MGDPVVHFEIIGRDPGALRRFYSALFGWEHDVGDVSSDAVSEQGNYGFITAASLDGVAGVNGGVGGGAGYAPAVLFYVGVEDVGAALSRAVELGGTVVLGPDGEPGKLVVGRFTDPEGNLVGVAGPR